MFETPLPDISNERDKHAAATQKPLRQQPPPVSAVAKIDLMALALSRFGEWRAGAAALVERYRAVVFDLSTPKGYAELTKAIAEVRAPRFAAQNVSKASKSELTSISKAIGAEEAAVAAYLADTEARLVKLRDDHDAKVAAEKAERERIAAERAQKQAEGVAGIRAYLSRAQTTADMTAERVGNGIKMLEAMTFAADDWLDPVAAASAQCETLEGLRTLKATLLAREIEADRLEAQRLQQEAERAELERQAAAMRAEQARIARLTAMIAEIRAAATGHDNASAADLYEARIAVAALDVSEAQYQELALVAQAAQAGTLAVLDRLHRDAVAREAERAEAERAEVERVLAIPLPLTIPDKPELLAQDECRELSKALAADPAAPLHAREAAAAIADAAVVDAAVKAGMDAVYAACVPMPGPTLTLGKFNEWIAPLKIDAAGLEALGFTAVKVHNAKLYHDTDKAAMVAAMIKHLQGL